MRTLAERLWAQVTKTETCWLWTGYVMASGHGQIQRGRRGEGTVRVHIAAWELANGPVPEGLILHHECHTKTCVRPDHLQPMTRREHQQVHRLECQTCPHGHPYDKVRKSGVRECRTCISRWNRESYQRRRQRVSVPG